MGRVTASLLLVLLLAAAAAAADPGDFAPAAGDPAARAPDEVLLKDGTLLQGRILEERDDVVVFETASLGRLEIPRAGIERLARAGERGGVRTDPDYNSLMFCPTPATLERGDWYFRDFELFILNFGYAVSDDLNVSVGTLFPISADVIMVSLGAKLRLLDRETGPLGLAVTGSATRLEEISFSSVGLVLGVGDRRRSLNLALSRAFDDDGDGETVLLLGADIQGTGRSKFFAEYMNSAALFLEDADDLEGFLNVGIRFFGADHSFSLSGFRPLTDDGDGLIAFPMLMYSRHW